MTYCTNVIGALFYLLKEILNLTTTFFCYFDISDILFFDIFYKALKYLGTFFLDFWIFLEPCFLKFCFVFWIFVVLSFLIFQFIFWVFTAFAFFMYQLHFRIFLILCFLTCSFSCEIFHIFLFFTLLYGFFFVMISL